MEVYKKIRNLRKQINYSQQMFADRIDVSRSVLSQIEINKLKPSIDIIAKIAKEFNIHISYFFEAEKEPYTDLSSSNTQELQEPVSEYNKGQCSSCNHLQVVNEIQQDVINSLEKTISTQFQLIELLEKKIEHINKETTDKIKD